MKQITITYKRGDEHTLDYVYVQIDGYTQRTVVIGRDLYTEPTLLSDEEPSHGLNDLLTGAINQYRKMSGKFKGQLELDFGEEIENN